MLAFIKEVKRVRSKIKQDLEETEDGKALVDSKMLHHAEESKDSSRKYDANASDVEDEVLSKDLCKICFEVDLS